MQNIKQVMKDSFHTLRLSFYIQLQVVTIDMDWLNHLVGIWSICLIVWSAIFIAGLVLRYLEIQEDYKQVGRVARMISLAFGY